MRTKACELWVMAIAPGFALEYCASKQTFSPERYEPLGVEILGMECPEPHDVAPNGEVEGPDDHARLEPRAHTVFPRPRRHYRASRTPPTIVRRPRESLSPQSPEPREHGRSSQPTHSRPRNALELPQRDRSLDCTKESVSAPRASDSSRDNADAAAGHRASLDRHRLASDALW